jgi:excisionase family DNA binding protein
VDNAHPVFTLCHTADMASRFLSLADVQEMLNISAAQAYSLVRSGELPAIQVGPKKVWRVEATKLEEYIEAQYARTRQRLDAGDL